MEFWIVFWLKTYVLGPFAVFTKAKMLRDLLKYDAVDDGEEILMTNMKNRQRRAY